MLSLVNVSFVEYRLFWKAGKPIAISTYFMMINTIIENSHQCICLGSVHYTRRYTKIIVACF